VNATRVLDIPYITTAALRLSGTAVTTATTAPVVSSVVATQADSSAPLRQRQAKLLHHAIAKSVRAKVQLRSDSLPNPRS
jgi:hypothetical protein